MELPRSSPARLTANATSKLPRLVLFLMCLVFAVPGLLGHDPWKPDDATSFGVMWTMASGHASDWLMPNVAGAPVFDAGPLMYWLGAGSILLGRTVSFLGLDDPLSARLATLVMVLVAALGVWYATYLLGRRPSAQPLALAFGGQPAPRDYGRTLADGSLLIMLGTLGLAERAHDSSPDIAALAMLCAAAYGLARGLDRPREASLWISLALAGLALSRGPWPALEIGLVYLSLVLFHPDWKSNRWPALYITLPLSALLLALWPIALVTLGGDDGRNYLVACWQYWVGFADGTNPELIRRAAKALTWSLLPGWPLALWAIYSWRRVAGAPHVLVPLLLFFAMLVGLAFGSQPAEWLFLLLVPGTVMLAAFGLPTLKRGAQNAVDWFSLLIYSIIALALWASWLSRMTSFPSAWATTLQRQVPGLSNEFHFGPLVGALLVSAAWIWLVRWRVVTHPKVLWRSVVLASGGVTLVWTLIMTLWVGEVDYSRTYRAVALELQDAMQKSAPGALACVRADNLGLAQRASFAYFANVHFASLDLDGNPIDSCPLVLRQDATRAANRDSPEERSHGAWKLIWEGRRPSDREERYRLYLETPPVVRPKARTSSKQ